MSILREIIQEPPVYDNDFKNIGNHFPSLIDLSLEAVHMGADKQAERLLDLRKFLIKHFEQVNALEWAEKQSNEEAYAAPKPPRTLG